MSKLILTRGVPASGKTTWAEAWVKEEPGKRARVNRDDLRERIFGGEGVLEFEQEQRISEIQKNTAKGLLKAGYDVVIDDTNLRAKFVKQWIIFASEQSVEVEFKDFIITRQSAIYRDSVRQGQGKRYVGPTVINNLFNKFIGKDGFSLPELPVMVQDDAKVASIFKPYIPGDIAAFSFDVDGTLAHMGDRRSPYDPTLYHLDEPDAGVVRLMQDASQLGYEIIVLSGRSEDYKAETLEWIEKHVGVGVTKILMRPSGDERNDAIIKSELVDKYISGVYNVIMHYDDRNRVVDALRAKGMKVSQVEPGDF